MSTTTLTRAEARRMLVHHTGLARTLGRGGRAIPKVLERLRCIQLDPLDPMGTNSDLVVMARVDEVGRGDLWKQLFPRRAFEHFAKERCILPAEAFPWYRRRGHAAQAPWWRHSEREARVPKKIVDRVAAEVRERGPLTARELSDHGAVDPIDWSGWKGTGKATSMALEILWTRCDVVVCGRTAGGEKLYDVPERALGPAASLPPRDGDDFERWALRERVRASGLLSRSGGSQWSMLSAVRTSPLPEAMVSEGELQEVAIEGSSRRYLTLPSFLQQSARGFDGRVRILGPLDPLMWDRDLVRSAFDFDYIWEVYKPEPLRKWGWYVCPLLHQDRLIGRVDARIEDNVLKVRRLWLEAGEIDPGLIRESLERHAAACGCRGIGGRLRPARMLSG
jgi:uncharacterized protein YcaQ